MLKSVRTIGAALALSVMLCVLSPVRSDEALAQSTPLYVNAVDIDVVPGQIDNYLAALKENAAASVHEPGFTNSSSRCRKRIRTTYSYLRFMITLRRWTRTSRRITSRNTRPLPRILSPSATPTPYHWSV